MKTCFGKFNYFRISQSHTIKIKTVIFSRGKNLFCANALVEDMGKECMMTALNIDDKPMQCLQSCQIQSESIAFSYSAFPIKQTFPQHQYYCLTLEKLTKICQHPFKGKYLEESMLDSKLSCQNITFAKNDGKVCSDKNMPNTRFVRENQILSNYLYEYAKTNFAVLRVFIKDPFYTKIRRQEEMPRLSFMGNVGGLLGLSMGFSVVSIFEIFYHFFDCLLVFMRQCVSKQ